MEPCYPVTRVRQLTLISERFNVGLEVGDFDLPTQQINCFASFSPPFMLTLQLLYFELRPSHLDLLSFQKRSRRVRWSIFGWCFHSKPSSLWEQAVDVLEGQFLLLIKLLGLHPFRLRHASAVRVVDAEIEV